MDSTLFVILLVCTLVLLVLLFFAFAIVVIIALRKTTTEQIRQMFATFNDINMRLIASNTELSTGHALSDSDIRYADDDIKKTDDEKLKAALNMKPSEPFNPFAVPPVPAPDALGGDSIDPLTQSSDVGKQVSKGPKE